jgi:hypothetical protein
MAIEHFCLLTFFEERPRPYGAEGLTYDIPVLLSDLQPSPTEGLGIPNPGRAIRKRHRVGLAHLALPHIGGG